jgi:phasin family protein
MDSKIFEKYQEFGENFFAAAKDLEALNTKTFEKLTGKQIEFANAAIEAGTRFTTSLGSVKALPEFLAEQTKLAAELNEQFIAAARSAADIISESREAYQAWFERGVKALTGSNDFAVPAFVFPFAPSKKAA